MFRFTCRFIQASQAGADASDGCRWSIDR